MDIIDLHDTSRVDKNPNETKFLLQNGNFIQDEFEISDIELETLFGKSRSKTGFILSNYLMLKQTRVQLK